MPTKDCPHCGKKADGFDFDDASGCKRPSVFGICVGEWECIYDPENPPAALPEQPETTTVFVRHQGSLIRLQQDDQTK